MQMCHELDSRWMQRTSGRRCMCTAFTRRQHFSEWNDNWKQRHTTSTFLAGS